MKRFNLDWKVGYTGDPSNLPEKYVSASVPGAVQLDWARAEGWRHYWQDDTLQRYEWMERMYWVYETELVLPEVAEGHRAHFVCGGVDYRFIVRLGGKTIHGQEGMFTPFEFDLTELAKDGDTLQIIVFPVPDSEDGSVGRAEASHSVKPAVSYGWDFHPRLISAGIWKETYLEIRHERHIQTVNYDYALEDDFSIARVDLSVELNAKTSGLIEWTLLHPSGEVVDGQSVSVEDYSVIDCVLEAHDPSLWWPHGYGDQIIYTINVSLHDATGILVDSKNVRIGFRRCRLVMNEGAWEVDEGMPASRSVPPMTLEINGTRIFAKGSNWVAPDIFPGVVGEDTYRPLLEKVVGANMNLLRCWGGSATSKPSFFDLCDQMGIMVWQDFPLACNNYRESPEYLDTLNQESVSIINQLKPHPCVVLWCGGNELFNFWSGMTDQHQAIRLLNKNCLELDPDTPFIPTSPIMGVGHGGYLFRDSAGRECLEVFQSARKTAYVEFGVPGPSSVDRLRSFIKEEDLYPPRKGGVWQARHAFGAWEGDSDSWLCVSTIEYYFGHAESIDELVEWGQLLQSEGYKALFEEARRQKPRCSMALNWCFNEPWPTAANNSLVSWPCEPKPAYHAVKQSCRPVLASARVKKYSWSDGETFEAELWMLNDSPTVVKGDRIEAYLRFDDEEIFVLGWYFNPLDPDRNEQGPVLRYRLPVVRSQTFRLILRVEGRQDWNSEYEFCFRED